MVGGPVAGLHYPAATGEFMAWFSTDADCPDYLEWLRWPAGFVCPECGQGGWRLGDQGRVIVWTSGAEQGERLMLRRPRGSA